jgi:hypothetical protein
MSTWTIGVNVPWTVACTGEPSFEPQPSVHFPGLSDVFRFSAGGPMRRAFAIVLLMTIFESCRAIAGTCSSRDGQKYCTCEYNQRCISSENSCACTRSADEPQTPFLALPQPRPSQPPVIRIPNPLRREPAPAMPAPPPGAAGNVDNDERAPTEYVQLAKTAIAAGRLAAAIELIDKGQTRLLDRSVALNKTFDPITDESIKQLSLAKQALLSKNRERAEKSLDAALAAMQ